MTDARRLQIHTIADRPIAEVRYLNAARRGGTEVRRLAIERAIVSGLPDGLDAIVATSDLQGIVPAPGHGEATLLGVAVAEALEQLADDGSLPPSQRTGVVLAGDLYSVPGANKRGGHGDVTDVWRAFGDRFAWVVGVLGNHDDLGGDDGVARLVGSGPIHVLDGEVVVLDGLRLGGVSRIIGDPGKLGRRDADEQLTRLELVIEERVDLLVLHEGPHGDDDQSGHPDVRVLIERGRVPLTISGHVHWERPLAAHPHGQLLGVDSRVVVLIKA